MRDERGFALILTLVVTALMVAVAVELVYQVYVDISLNRNFRDSQQAAALAESGACGGAQLLQSYLSRQSYSSLGDLWAVPLRREDPAGRIEVSVSEESGKLNLNALVLANGTVNQSALENLQRLGTVLELPDGIWQSLADWMDGDDLALPGGAESAYYQSLDPPYAARNKPLVSLTELSLVRGFTPQIVAALKPFVTLYPNQSGTLANQCVNVNTAPREVLMALDSGIDLTLVQRILEERASQPFKSAGDLARADSRLAVSLTGRVVFKGTVFRIISRGFVKEAARSIETVARVDGKPEYLFWQEY